MQMKTLEKQHEAYVQLVSSLEVAEFQQALCAVEQET